MEKCRSCTSGFAELGCPKPRKQKRGRGGKNPTDKGVEGGEGKKVWMQRGGWRWQGRGKSSSLAFVGFPYIEVLGPVAPKIPSHPRARGNSRRKTRCCAQPGSGRLQMPFSHLKPACFWPRHELGEEPGAQAHPGPPKDVWQHQKHPRIPSSTAGPGQTSHLFPVWRGMSGSGKGPAGSRLIFKLVSAERDNSWGGLCRGARGALPQSDTVNLQPELEAGPG